MEIQTLCGKRVRHKKLSEPRPCIREQGHSSKCSPDLLGLRFTHLTVISQGEFLPYAYKGCKKFFTWNCIDESGRVRNNIPSHTLLFGSSRGVKNPRGTGSTHQGYRFIPHNKKCRPEHRVVMEKILGRPLTSKEQVHHGPKGRACNTPDNLSIRLVGQHPKGHSEQELANWLRSLGWIINPPARLKGTTHEWAI